MATPFPWARMESYIESIFTSPYILRRDIIGHTPMNENQDALPQYYQVLSDPGDPTRKRNVVVLRGMHPGEVNNSWMLTGLMACLLSDNALTNSLRQTFAFHIYPAVNPEGVKYGHYRLTADNPFNPNRAWPANEVLEIEIVREHLLFYTQGRADYFFDLHGDGLSKYFICHSRKDCGGGHALSSG